MLAETFLKNMLSGLPDGASALDVGCGETGFYFRSRQFGKAFTHSGCDLSPPSRLPENYDFRAVDLEELPLPYEDDSFDLVVVSHVIEHVRNPVELIGEAIRVLAPGGTLYIEAPSDRSTKASLGHSLNWNLIFSYYDDPTHIGRPWTPQAFHRLGAFYGLEDNKAGYDMTLWHRLLCPFAMLWHVLKRDPDALVLSWWRGTGWACYFAGQKPMQSRGALPFNYFSYRGKPIGYKP